MKIIVLDDDKLVTVSLRTILEAEGGITVAAEGHCGEDAVRLYGEVRPDVALMDIRMEGRGGLWAAEEILRQDREAKILFLTTFSDDAYILRALDMGAKGYILKQDFEGIVPALRAVHGGQSVFGGAVANKIPVLLQPREAFDYRKYEISGKERDIIELVAEGLNNREIAARLFLSEGTVRNYISAVLEKLGLRDRTQLAVFYYTHGR